MVATKRNIAIALMAIVFAIGIYSIVCVDNAYAQINEEDSSNIVLNSTPISELPEGQSIVNSRSSLTSADGVADTPLPTAENLADATAEEAALQTGTAGSQAAPSISYEAHVQDVGWQGERSDGQTAGTEGQAKRVEAIEIDLDLPSDMTGSVEYQVHVQDIGWQGWAEEGEMAGTEGQSLRVEAFQALLSGDVAQLYNIMYRAHVQDIGWQDWVCNGEIAGTVGMALRIEALEIKLVPFVVQSHVQDIGWQDLVVFDVATPDTASAAAIAGTTGQALRVEALKIYAPGVSYQAHVENIGWQEPESASGRMAGTTGRGLRVEAVKIALTGALADMYDIFYRVHVQDLGWLDWAKNGAIAGTTALSYRVEALQIALLSKGQVPIEGTEVPYVKPQSVYYQSHATQGGAWQDPVADGEVSGTTGQGIPLDLMRAYLADPASGEGVLNGALMVSAHSADEGWRDAVSGDVRVGAPGNQLEALKIELTGTISKFFNVYYRVHIAERGWLGWAADDEVAGSVGKKLGIQAFEIVLLPAGKEAPGSTAGHQYLSRIYLDAGHGWGNRTAGVWDSGATGNGYQEAELNIQLVELVASYARDFGLDVVTNSNKGVSLYDRQTDAQNLGCTSFVSIHFNSGGGTGSESYSYTPQSAALQSIMHNALIVGVGLKDRGAMNYGYNVLCGSLPATLLEVAFIDNSHDMSVYMSRMDYIAQKLAEGLLVAVNAGY